MKRAYILAGLLAIVLSVGCGKKGAGLSGVYKRHPYTPAADFTFTFQDDGTFEIKSTGEVVKGAYKLEGRNLSMTATEVDGKPAQGNYAEPHTATLSEDGKSFNTGQVEYRKQE